MEKIFYNCHTGDNVGGSFSLRRRFYGGGMNAGPAKRNYSSYLPDVYVGSPNRIERYGHYNTMDLDSEVNAALDILAEFCSQKNTQNKTPFLIDFPKRKQQTQK